MALSDITAQHNASTTMTAARQIFRKTALERLASPEDLDQAIAIASGGSWLALSAVLLVGAAVLGWALFGTLTTTAAGSGRILQTANGFELRATVPVSEAGEIRPGMTAQIVPATVRREDVGFIRGTVAAVTSTVSDDSRMDVRIVLDRDAQSDSGFGWSSGRGPAIGIPAGTPAAVEIVTQQRAPISWVVPHLRQRRTS
jgi:hypothetical protein